MSSAQLLTSYSQYQNIVERDEALALVHRALTGVTVVIPCYNQQESLIETLASVYAQTYPPYEVIVVDDGSPEPVQLPYNHTEIPTKLVRVTNRGLPSARNTGLMLTNTLGFLPLDADDQLAPEYIEKTVQLLADADVVMTGLQEHGPTRNGVYMPGFDRPYDQVDEEIMWSYNRFFYCSLFRTQTLREVGGYHSQMSGWPGVHGGYEDWDLWIDLMRRGTRFVAVNEVLFHYTTKPDGMLVAAESNRDALVSEMKRHHGV